MIFSLLFVWLPTFLFLLTCNYPLWPCLTPFAILSLAPPPHPPSPSLPLFTSSMEEGVRSSGSCGGVVLSCTDKLNRRTVLVRPVSKQDTFSHFSGFFPPVRIHPFHFFLGWLCFTSSNSGTKKTLCMILRDRFNLVWLLLRNFPLVLN